jgi:hypothetical protein
VKSLSESSNSTENPFKDKWISIIGSKASTTVGFNLPDRFTPGDPLFPINSHLEDRDKLWWVQLIRKLGAKLCSNATGHHLKVYDPDDVGNSFYKFIDKVKREASTVYMNISGDTELAKYEQNPDIIIIETTTMFYAKMNTETTNIDEMPYDETHIDGYSDRALKLLITLLRSTYPDAQIYIMNIGWNDQEQMNAPSTAEGGKTTNEYNNRIEEIARYFHLPLIKIDQLGPYFYTHDGEKLEIGYLGDKCQDILARKCYNDMMAYGVA